MSIPGAFLEILAQPYLFRTELMWLLQLYFPLNLFAQIFRLEECLELLCKSDHLPKAAFLARTYLPSQISLVVQLWKADLTKRKAADSLADPTQYTNLFPDLQEAVKAEEVSQAKLNKTQGVGLNKTIGHLGLARLQMADMLDSLISNIFYSWLMIETTQWRPFYNFLQFIISRYLYTSNFVHWVSDYSV